MDLNTVLGILTLVCLAYLGHESEKEQAKRKLMSRASLVNIRGVQAQWRLERVNEIRNRTRSENIHRHLPTHRYDISYVDDPQKNSRLAPAWKRT